MFEDFFKQSFNLKFKVDICYETMSAKFETHKLIPSYII